ncbi:MAG: hypothetical protein J3K34DRAFT_400314 [Monoraphidium minutum]|nr:MAG: hypothetical protein J3K34DRAFT_400314 [Monoraphidium minutum]
MPRFPYEGLSSDLPALLAGAARGKEVAIVAFHEATAPLALNCIVSLAAFGGAHDYIVAAAGGPSLARCAALRLPCFDAGPLLANATTLEQRLGGSKRRALGAGAGDEKAVIGVDGGAKRDGHDWYSLVWMKTLVTHAANALGYDVMFADADTVFLRDAWAAYRGLLERYDADGTFMYEQGDYTRSDGTSFAHHFLNSGNFLLRSNARTRHMMEMWRLGYEFQVGINGNQLWLTRLDKMGYKICHEKEVCSQLKADNWAAVKPHPDQFAAAGAACAPAALGEGLCSDRRLYVHAVCRQGHHQKVAALKRLGLWFVRVDPSDHTKVEVTLPKGGALPCQGTPWNENYTLSS